MCGLRMATKHFLVFSLLLGCNIILGFNDFYYILLALVNFFLLYRLSIFHSLHLVVVLHVLDYWFSFYLFGVDLYLTRTLLLIRVFPSILNLLDRWYCVFR